MQAEPTLILTAGPIPKPNPSPNPGPNPNPDPDPDQVKLLQLLRRAGRLKEASRFLVQALTLTLALALTP